MRTIVWVVLLFAGLVPGWSSATSILGDQIFGYVSPPFSSTNLFSPNSAVVGPGVEFSRPAPYFYEADFTNETVTVRLTNTFDGSLSFINEFWAFSSLQWTPGSFHIVGLAPVSNTFPGDVTTSISNGGAEPNSNNITIRRQLPGNTGLQMPPGAIYETTFSILLGNFDSIPGDYNGNEAVEQGDLDLVLLSWGQFGRPAAWISDRPVGPVDQEELDGVLLNWGNSAEPAGASVPEPAAAGLIALAALGTAGRRPGVTHR